MLDGESRGEGLPADLGRSRVDQEDFVSGLFLDSHLGRGCQDTLPEVTGAQHGVQMKGPSFGRGGKQAAAIAGTQLCQVLVVQGERRVLECRGAGSGAGREA